ncbi:MAG: M23 family metallopeptidase [Muribaculaceae bacterium]|nr:M23 family metallopeptidase [Muribaculaceae bacterium]
MDKDKVTQNKKLSTTKRPFKSPKRFRLSFVNENTFNEVWTIKMSQTKVVVSIIAIVGAVACVMATLIAFTPIRTLLPGYLKTSQRQENIVNSMMVDSLKMRVDINNAYLQNITDILTDNVVVEEVVIPNDSAVSAIPVDSIMGASPAELQFIQQFEDDERYNLSVLSPLVAEGMLFYAPVSGATVEEQLMDGSMALSLIVSSLSPVSAVYAGTVVDVYYDAMKGNVVIIQHSNDFLSKYIGVGETMCQVGAKVVAGQRIGMISRNPDSRFVFELWHKGTALQPLDYIAF